MKATQFMALAILEANKVREHYLDYSLRGDDDEVSLEDLKDVISQYVPICIDVKTADWGAHRFLGTIQRYENKAIIIVAKRGQKGEEGRLTLCEQRFVLAKEMGHLVIDSADNFTKNAVELVDDLCSPMLAKLDGRHQLQSEYITEIFAIECLFPYHRRQGYFERIRNGDLTPLEVATHFRIPEKQVRVAMHPDYEEACRHIYKLLD